MRRFLPRAAAVLLSTVSLGACGLFGIGGASGSADAVPAPAKAIVDRDGLASDATSLNEEVRKAQLLRAQGNLDEAVRSLSQLMLMAPDDPRVVGEYGKALAQQGRSQDAVAFLKRAVELQPNDWTFYSALGVAYDQMGDPQNAKLAYERALSLAPGEPALLNNYAMSRMLAGDPATARQMIALAGAKSSADPKIARNAALIASYAPPSSLSAPVTNLKGAVASKSTALPIVATTQPRTLASGVVMQRVPVDPLAGPVDRAKADHHVAAAKTAKAATVVRKKTPDLRVSADAT